MHLNILTFYFHSKRKILYLCLNNLHSYSNCTVNNFLNNLTLLKADALLNYISQQKKLYQYFRGRGNYFKMSVKRNFSVILKSNYL